MKLLLLLSVLVGCGNSTTQCLQPIPGGDETGVERNTGRGPSPCAKDLYYTPDSGTNDSDGGTDGGMR